MSKDAKKFFKTEKPESKVKSLIVSEYFPIWFNIVGSSVPHVCYMDLFSGPGRYCDGGLSTPLRILDKINELVENGREAAAKTQLTFCEGDRELFDKLVTNIQEHPTRHRLRIKPQLLNKKITPKRFLEFDNDSPTMGFVDPFGLRGVGLNLLAELLQHWGSDLFFFLNMDAVHRTIRKNRLGSALRRLLGAEFEALRKSWMAMDEVRGPRDLNESKIRVPIADDQLHYSPDHPLRHRLMFEALRTALSADRKTRVYLLPFGIQRERERAIRQYLVFITKHRKGFQRCLDLMNKFGIVDTQGWPRLLWGQNANANPILQCDMRSQPLSDWLSYQFSDSTVSGKDVFDMVAKEGIVAVRKNIQATLEQMEQQDLVHIERAKGKETIGEKATIRFPKR